MADVSKGHGDTQAFDGGERPSGFLIGDCQGNQASAVLCDFYSVKELTCILLQSPLHVLFSKPRA